MHRQTVVRRAVTAPLLLTLLTWGLTPSAPASAAEADAAGVTLTGARGSLQVVGSFSRVGEPVPDRYSFDDAQDFGVNYLSSDSGQVSFDGVHMSSAASQSTTLLFDGQRLTGLLSLGTVTARGLGTGAGTVQTTGGATASTELEVTLEVAEPVVWRLVATSRASRQQTRPDEEVCRTAVIDVVADDVGVDTQRTCEDGQAEAVVDETVTLPAGEVTVYLSVLGAALARSVSGASGLANGSWDVSFREVAAAPDLASTAPPEVSGVARAGRTLRASAGGWAGEPTDLAFRWLRGGRPIPGATRPTYRVRPADAGRSLRVRVRASRPGSPSVEALSAPRQIARQLFATSPPRIRGTAAPGRTVRATRGAWTARPARLRYRWLRDGRPIPGATASTYLVRRSDDGSRLRVRVRAERPGHLDGTARSTTRTVR